MAESPRLREPVSWAHAPDGVSDEARDLWPDISEWPTSQTILKLVAARRNRPDHYQSVVNGLRWCTSADLTPARSLLTTWMAVVAIVLAALSSSFGAWGAVGCDRLRCGVHRHADQDREHRGAPHRSHTPRGCLAGRRRGRPHNPPTAQSDLALVELSRRVPLTTSAALRHRLRFSASGVAALPLRR